jgi:putative membrane protein
MLEFIAEWQPWMKAAHIFFVIAWMAGMLYLPRLFVYHADAKPGSELSETLKIMERRLLRGIMNPAMFLVWMLGAAQFPLFPDSLWLDVKIGLVVIMTVFHHLYARWRKDFLADRNTRSARFYRFMNEVPALLLALILILVVVKPF